MEKIKIDTGAGFLYPMPMVLVGSVVKEKPNFMAVGWVSRVNFKPALFAIALGPHYTNVGIDENKALIQKEFNIKPKGIGVYLYFEVENVDKFFNTTFLCFLQKVHVCLIVHIHIGQSVLLTRDADG